MATPSRYGSSVAVCGFLCAQSEDAESNLPWPLILAFEILCVVFVYMMSHVLEKRGLAGKSVSKTPPGGQDRQG